MSEEFRFFSWDEDPLNKYTQPKPNGDSTGQNGYPEKDVDVGITKMDMRGAGAAEKGKKFVSELNMTVGSLAGVLTRQGKERGSK